MTPQINVIFTNAYNSCFVVPMAGAEGTIRSENIKMKHLLLLTTIAIFISGCSASTISFDDQTIQMLKDSKLLYAFDYFGLGISLGMLGLEIRFEKADYDKDSHTIYLQGQVIDESTKEPVPSVKVYIARKLNYDDSLKGYRIILSDSVQTDQSGNFEIKTKLEKNSVITSKVIGFYGRVYNIGELKK